MYGIRVEDAGTEVRVGMHGEFDACCLTNLRRSLDDASASGRPVVVDLSGVTFLDLQSTRDLIVRSLTQPRNLTFENPSSGVLWSVRAFGMEVAAHAHPGREEPQIFSGA